MDFEQIVSHFTALTSTNLPGNTAHKAMIPTNRRTKHQSPQNSHKKDSAVLILLYKKENKIMFVLIKRPEYNGHHSGQISFPGGKFDILQDKDLKVTALRETFEEIGIPPKSISIITALSPLHIPISNINVFPFIGICKELPIFTTNSEVDYIIEVPINQLLTLSNKQITTMNINSELVNVPFYNIYNEVVWGATAMILSEFEYLLKQID